jgi:hypothetical protein
MLRLGGYKDKQGNPYINLSETKINKLTDQQAKEVDGVTRESNPELWLNHRKAMRMFLAAQNLYKVKQNWNRIDVEWCVNFRLPFKPFDYTDVGGAYITRKREELTKILTERLNRHGLYDNVIEMFGISYSYPELPDVIPIDANNEVYVPGNKQRSKRRRKIEKSAFNKRYANSFIFFKLYPNKVYFFKTVKFSASPCNGAEHNPNIVVAYIACSECMDSKDAYKDENNGTIVY